MYFIYKDFKLYYNKIGTGNQNILILPGWGNTRETFRYIIDHFKEKYTIYIIDYPGFGNSPIINKELTIYDYAGMINKFINKNNINDPIIISHSFGGRITAILINKYNIPAKKIILIDVAGIKRFNIKIFIKQKIYKFIKIMINLLPLKYRYIIYKKTFNYFSSNDYKNLPPNMYKTFKNIIKENIKNHYKKIKTGTLIIWGKNDKDTPIKDAYLLNRIIKSSKLIIYKNSGHFSYLDNIEKINKEIEEYIK